MKAFSTTLGIFVLAAMLVAASAGAQNVAPVPLVHVDDTHSSPVFDLHPELTKNQFEEFTADLGSVLRFRALGDATTVKKGSVDVGVQFGNAALDDGKAAWINTMSYPAADGHVSPSMSFPRVVARFGVSDRVDVGALGGISAHANYGLVGIDTRIALVKEGPSRPVSVLVRPSFALLIAPSQVVVGNASADVSVTRAFGAVSPYVGLAASSFGAVERSEHVDLDPVSAGGPLSYAGVSYLWQRLILSAEVEKGTKVRYAFGVGTRF